jgi:hypothetical protein
VELHDRCKGEEKEEGLTGTAVTAVSTRCATLRYRARWVAPTAWRSSGIGKDADCVARPAGKKRRARSPVVGRRSSTVAGDASASLGIGAEGRAMPHADGSELRLRATLRLRCGNSGMAWLWLVPATERWRWRARFSRPRDGERRHPAARQNLRNRGKRWGGGRPSKADAASRRWLTRRREGGGGAQTQHSRGARCTLAATAPAPAMSSLAKTGGFTRRGGCAPVAQGVGPAAAERSAWRERAGVVGTSAPFIPSRTALGQRRPEEGIQTQHRATLSLPGGPYRRQIFQFKKIKPKFCILPKTNR